jgi:hypothetical protein
LEHFIPPNVDIVVVVVDDLEVVDAEPVVVDKAVVVPLVVVAVVVVAVVIQVPPQDPSQLA